MGSAVSGRSARRALTGAVLIGPSHGLGPMLGVVAVCLYGTGKSAWGTPMLVWIMVAGRWKISCAQLVNTNTGRLAVDADFTCAGLHRADVQLPQTADKRPD